MNTQNQPAVQPPSNAPASRPKATIQTRLESPEFLRAVAQVLPKCLTPDRFVRIALLAINKTPKLLLCSQASFFNAMMTLAQYGIEADGRRAHLIPFENKAKGRGGPPVYEVQLIIDYKGLAELIYRSGVVSYLHADVVREGDIFDYSKGELRSHVPWYLRRDADRPKSPGETFAVYALVRMKDGSEKVEPLAIEEVNSIRDNSQGWRAFKKGYAKQSPWDPANPVSEQEMQKKTAFRRLSKWLPLSPEIRDAVDHDDEPAAPTIDISTAAASNLVSFAGLPEQLGDGDDASDGSNAPLNSDGDGDGDDGDLAPQATAQTIPPPTDEVKTPQVQLMEVVTAAGFNFNVFQRWGESSGNLANASSLPGFRAVPTDVCDRLLKSLRSAKTRQVMLQQLQAAKEELL